jgi:ribosomal protein S18 acetylase RimI-like enzyme
MCSGTVASAPDGVKGVGLDSAGMNPRDFRGAQFAWRGVATDDELVALTQSYGGAAQAGWWDRIRPHSLGWVTARIGDGTLIGFVNVAWDGGDHAFLIDTKVHPDQQRRGIGTELVRIAVRHAKEAGCEWIEVDFDEPLAPFYYDACGFVPTQAGLVHLPDVDFAAPPSDV